MQKKPNNKVRTKIEIPSKIYKELFIKHLLLALFSDVYSNLTHQDKPYLIEPHSNIGVEIVEATSQEKTELKHIVLGGANPQHSTKDYLYSSIECDNIFYGFGLNPNFESPNMKQYTEKHLLINGIKLYYPQFWLLLDVTKNAIKKKCKKFVNYNGCEEVDLFVFTLGEEYLQAEVLPLFCNSIKEYITQNSIPYRHVFFQILSDDGVVVFMFDVKTLSVERRVCDATLLKHIETIIVQEESLVLQVN